MKKTKEEKAEKTILKKVEKKTPGRKRSAKVNRILDGEQMDENQTVDTTTEQEPEITMVNTTEAKKVAVATVEKVGEVILSKKKVLQPIFNIVE